MAYSIPSLNLYGMLSDIGDTIQAGSAAQNEEAQKLWARAQMAAAESGKPVSEWPAQPKAVGGPLKQLLEHVISPTEQPAASAAVAPPTTASPQPSGGGAYNFAQLYDMFKKEGAPDALARDLSATYLAESRGNPLAHNTKAPDDSYGLGQINMFDRLGPERRTKFGLTDNSQLYDVPTNIRAGLAIARGPGGLNNWSTYKSGAYRQFLPQGEAPVQVADASGHVGIGGAPASAAPVESDFPIKALRTPEGIMAARENPFYKPFIQGATDAYMKAQRDAKLLEQRKIERAEDKAFREKLREDDRTFREQQRQDTLAEKRAPENEKPTEAQANASIFATRMAKANQIISDPSVYSVALGLKGSALQAVGDIPGVGNLIVGSMEKGPAFQKYDQAKRDFVNAILRKESGAAINRSEFINAEKQYFPIPGDGPDVIAQKAENRRTAVEAIANTGTPSFRKNFAEQYRQGTSTITSPPKMGTVSIPPDKARALRERPHLRDAFDKQYGKGAADQILGPAKVSEGVPET